MTLREITRFGFQACKDRRTHLCSYQVPWPQGDEGPPSGSREGTVITDVVGGVHPPHMPQEADTLYHVLYRKKLHFTEDRERYPLKSVAEEGAA